MVAFSHRVAEKTGEDRRGVTSWVRGMPGPIVDDLQVAQFVINSDALPVILEEMKVGGSEVLRLGLLSGVQLKRFVEAVAKVQSRMGDEEGKWEVGGLFHIRTVLNEKA
jgi:hypothetical protein